MIGVATSEWDRLSRHYDRQLWLERLAVRIALDLLAPVRDERMLDVATGTGEVLRQLAQRRERPREVVGIDTSAAMLSIRAHAASRGVVASSSSIRHPIPTSPFRKQ